MEKIKFKFVLSIIMLINTLIIVIFYGDLVYILDDYVIPVLFVYFFADTIIALFPYFNTAIFSGKQFKKLYIEQSNYQDATLQLQIKKANRRALLVFILYFAGLVTFMVLYQYIPYLEAKHVYILFFALNVSDYFCILIWCPFQTIFLGNKCCNTCRIANWDRPMKFTILLLIPNFYTVTIFITSILVFILWEWLHYRHPERYYSMSNKRLRCDHCDEVTCRKHKKNKVSE